MEIAKKPKIKAIFPLTYMQQGLLFHHLINKDDQGFLNVVCVLNGSMNLSLFEEAWNQTVRRHDVLRTTVHWRDIEKPVTIVHHERTISLTYFDWSESTRQDNDKKWEELQDVTFRKGVNFENGPLLTFTLVNCGNYEHRLLWPTHHLLIDGWSSQIILNDFLIIYDALIKGQEPLLAVLPSFKSYLNWIDKKNMAEASAFWSSSFENFKDVALFGDSSQAADGIIPLSSSLKLSSGESEKLRLLARACKVTLNTLVQGAWSILLGRYFHTDDVTYGVTVSGRSADFPNIQLLTGMFMNVQPVRSLLNTEVKLSDWFQDIQVRQHKARNYEHVNLDEIASFIEWPEARPLFDSILIFENFPLAQSENTVLKMVDYKSGITSTYPVTIAVVPNEEILFTISASPDVVDRKSFSWLIENWKTLMSNILMVDQGETLQDLLVSIPFFENSKSAKNQEAKKIKDNTEYVAPRNETELELVKIWEHLFGRSSIGIKDDFFSLGGKSLLAAKMFAIINKRMKVHLLPTTLLEHKTIGSIASLLTAGADSNSPSWKNLAPVRAKGTKPALFCVHAGGGHVFFYNLLAKYLSTDRPIYALQPSGIFGNESMHNDIEAMAQAYSREIQIVQPKGPYNLMVYCFSTAVGLEMSRILKSGGFETNLIVMDTMAEQRHLMTKTRMKMRLSGFFKRMLNNPSKVVGTMFADRYNMYLRPQWVKLFGSVEQKNTERIRLHLFDIYTKYKWQPHRLDIKLVLTKKADKRFNMEYIRSWEEIALDGVEIIETLGDHRTLFDEPDVQMVAKTIDGMLL